MCIDAKGARCWKYSPIDSHIHFPPGSAFQPNRTAVATGLSFVNTLCTRSEDRPPILMENNKNHYQKDEIPKGHYQKDDWDSLLLTWLIKTNPNTKYEALMS